MLAEHESPPWKPVKVDDPGPVFIPGGNDVEDFLMVNKAWESVPQAMACGVVDPERSGGRANYADH